MPTGLKKTNSFVMEEITKRIQALKQKSHRDTTANFTSSATVVDCPLCQDLGYIVKSWDGAGLAAVCACLERKRIEKRFQSAMIPEEFAHATLENYQVKYPFQRTLWEAATQYVREFEQIKRNTENSLGFVAVYGEERMNELPPEQRVIMKRKHNSFGLGKTHLQVAIAKELIQRGNTVLMVSDVALMEEVMGLKQSDYPLFHERIQSLIQVPVLIWDDIGKANPTPSRQSVYYRVINERWRTQRPILFSSNEDIETLAVRIGDGAASRLLGMAKGRIYRVEGPDCRLSMI